MRDRSDGPPDLGPRQAAQRYINARQTEWRDETAETYWYRLKLFVEWCEGQGIQRVDDLDGWSLDSYENARAGEGIAPATLESEMKTLKNFIEYLERIEIVDDGLAEKVHIPNVEKSDKSSDVLLEHQRARDLLRHYRNTAGQYGTREHIVLELAWFTGARSGAIRGLDVRDYHVSDHFMEFHHRPETDTPLKNGIDGQRPVGVPSEVTDVVEYYQEYNRLDVHDDHGRQPLITTRTGRMSENTIRRLSYAATFPCHYGDCPHGREPATCEYTEHNQESKCPSSRSPHRVRTGSVTWQRDLGFPPEVVAERVNSSIEVIEQHYDKASKRERLERRRRHYVQRMDLDATTDTDP